MTRNGKIVLGTAAAAVVGLGVAGAFAEREHFGHGWGHHGKHGGGMGMMGAVCHGNPAEMIDHMAVNIEYKVKPTDAQKAAFEELKATMKSAAEKAKAGCPKHEERAAAPDGTKPERAHKTPIERLAQTQTSLEASLDAIKTVRPAAEKFYASLTAEQKAALTEHTGGGHWGGHGGDRGGERGEHGERGHERGPATPAPGTAPPAPRN